MIPIRRFNKQGIDRFRGLLAAMRSGAEPDVDQLLWDEDLGSQVSNGPILNLRPFSNRLEAGKYLHDILTHLGEHATGLEEDAGLWAWLAAAWLEHLAPVKQERRKVGAEARWIPAVGDYQRYYRHLLAGPFLIYQAHKGNPSRAMAILATPVHSPGDAVEQLASRQEIVSNPSLLEAASLLYYDANEDELKRGSGGKGPGSPRRLAKDMLEQFALTWDFYGMEAAEIIDLLPPEFDRFRPNM